MIHLEFSVSLRQGGFSLEAADDAAVEVLGLYGPSGSGKTSLLEVIAGLRTPERGRVRVSGDLLLDTDTRVNVPAHRRHVGYVPQDVALFPHLDVRANLLYGVRRQASDGWRYAPDGSRRPAPGSRHELQHVCDMLEIAPLLHRRVGELSGGERQRIAIGRALMSAPRVVLLDEPLAAVDRDRKDRILPYLLRIRSELHVPMVYVTHDAREMRAIADRMVRLDEGRILDAGPPADVLERAPLRLQERP